MTDPRSPWLKRSFGQVTLNDCDRLDLDQMKRVNVHTSVKRNDSLDQDAVLFGFFHFH